MNADTVSDLLILAFAVGGFFGVLVIFEAIRILVCWAFGWMEFR